MNCLMGLKRRWAASPPVADAEEMRMWPLVLRALALNLRAGSTLHEAVHRISYPRGYERTRLEILRFTQQLDSVTSWGAPAYLACLHMLKEELDGSTPPLRMHSRERLNELAISLHMSESAGAPLATSLERAAEHAEERIDAFLGRQSALSAPRATTRILSWLPLIGLGLGVLMGTDPVRVLTGSLIGALIGVLGAGLAYTGRQWTVRLIHRAEKESTEAEHLVESGGDTGASTGIFARILSRCAVPSRPESGRPGQVTPVDTALMLELLAAQLRAGASPVEALRTLAEALGSGSLRSVCQRLQLGSNWEAAWSDPSTGKFGSLREAVAPAYTGGSPSAALLLSLADAQRLSEHRAAERAAGKLSVALVVPLGLCSLPAFICLGIVPIVISLIPALAG